MYPDRPYYSFAESAMKHCYVHCTRKSVYSPFIKNPWPRPQSQRARWLQNARTRAALAVSMEKNEKTSVSKARLYTKSKKKSGWQLFYSQLPRLPTLQRVRAMHCQKWPMEQWTSICLYCTSPCSYQLQVYKLS